MNLDFETIRALSSPTRIRILSHSMKKEATTTNLSREIDKSKSTVSSHLETLVESGLLEKDQEDGRKRVVYRPTKKAEAIVEGKQRKVRFSVASSAVSGLLGLVLFWPVRSSFLGVSDSQKSSDTGADMMMQETIEESSRDAAHDMAYSDPLLLASLIFFSIAVSALLYGIVLRKLPED